MNQEITRNEITQEDIERVPGAYLDTVAVYEIAHNGVSPIYAFWAFYQKHGIAWDYAQASESIGQ